jgi:hypothetical protein
MSHISITNYFASNILNGLSKIHADVTPYIKSSDLCVSDIRKLGQIKDHQIWKEKFPMMNVYIFSLIPKDIKTCSDHKLKHRTVIFENSKLGKFLTHKFMFD